MIKQFLLVLLIIVFFAFNYSFAGTYSGGDGSESTPYQITDADDLVELMGTSNDWGSYFILTANINCSGYTWPTYYPSPIGNSDAPFTGNFNGQNYTISNITYIDDIDYTGFFGYVSQGTITNLNLSGITIDYSSYYIGSLCGYIVNGSISNCSTVSNIIAGYRYVGGFCGSINSSTLNNCASAGAVEGGKKSYYIGGFCGSNDGGTIQNCHSTGSAYGQHHIGGFCGQNIGSETIINCYSTGGAEGFYYIGGFCGYNDEGVIISSYSTGYVKGYNYSIGGFCGENSFNSLIKNCHSTGNVLASDKFEDEDNIMDVGGFCGLNLSTIKNCYSTGNADAFVRVGGFCGYNEYGRIDYSYCSGRAEGIDCVGGFCGSNDVGGQIISCHSSGNSYSYERVGGFAGENYNSYIYDCHSTGRAYGIQNKKAKGRNPLGVLVGGDDIGGFCGYNSYARIELSYSMGNAAGGNNVGGFCGRNTDNSTIKNCYSKGDVSGVDDYIGGFCGYNFNATIEYSYSYGNTSKIIPGGIYGNLGGFLGYDEYGTLTCNYWGYPNSLIDDIGNTGDVADGQIKETTPEEFLVPSSFACYDFGGVWAMGADGPRFAHVPTLTEWAAILFLGMIALVGGLFIWKRIL